MALPTSRTQREYDKFVETDGGATAIRTVGDTSTLAGGASQASGPAVYYAKPSGANGDGVTAYASATTLTITGLPFTFAAEDVESVEQIPTSGTSTVYSDKADYSVSGTTLTVTGATFASDDVFVVKLTGPTRGFDASSNGLNTNNNAPEWSHTQRSTHVLTNVPNATPDETVVVDLEGYQGCSFHVENTGGTDTWAYTFWASNEGTASTDDRIDITTNGTTLAGGTLTTDAFVHTNKGLRAKSVSLKVTTAAAANDADFNVFVYKW